MKHEPHDFEAPTRRAELKEWLATLRGPQKRVCREIQVGDLVWYFDESNACVGYGGTLDPMKRHT